jgi:signal transduction histidine kinase
MVGELEAHAAGSDDMKHALEVIRRNVELEARLIDDLLDVTRISKGKLQLSLETVSVHEILQRAYEICREDILVKNLRMEFRLRAESVHVEADPARLQQVFWNLIKNSVKFTPAQGRIIVETFNSSPDEIEIRTTDTGIGIEPEKIGKIFNAFEQGQSSITRRFGGLGLGLAISKGNGFRARRRDPCRERGPRSWRHLHRHAPHRRSASAERAETHRHTDTRG